MKLLIALFLGTVVVVAVADPLLIGGTPVPEGEHKEIVYISIGNARCSATVVGPKTIVTAAHCLNTNQQAMFSIDGVRYSVTGIRHQSYPRIDIDVSLGVSQKDIAVVPATISNTRVVVGDVFDKYGYGCTKPNGTGGNDGILRTGKNTVSGASGEVVMSRKWFRLAAVNYDIYSEDPKGGINCFGDSGSGVFIGGKQVAVVSKGDIKTKSWDLDLTHPDVQEWLVGVADQRQLDVCGISTDCVGSF